MFPYDASVAAAVATAAQSIPEVLQAMQTIDSICVDADGLKWFNWLYLQVTQAVEARVAAGAFADSAWLAQLDVQFGNLYFGALKAWLAGEDTPGCWRILFQSRNRNEVARIQFALAGINAHINHDLPEAVVATCQAAGTTPVHGGTNYNDYTALNNTLDSLIEEAKTALNFRLPGDDLPPVSHLEETLAAWQVGAARESAWQNAGHLWQMRGDELLTTGFLDVLDGFTTVIGKALMTPVP